MSVGNLACVVDLEAWIEARNPRGKPSISIIFVVTAHIQRVVWDTLAPTVAMTHLPRIATNGAVRALAVFGDNAADPRTRDTTINLFHLEEVDAASN